MDNWIGYYIIGCGIIHNIVGLTVPKLRQPLIDLFKSGLINKVDPHYDRYASVFFQALGFWWIAIGHLFVFLSWQNIKIPSFFGWYMLAINIATVVVIPKSGFWALLIPAIWLIMN